MTITVSSLPPPDTIKAYVVETSQSLPVVFIDARKFQSIIHDRLGTVPGSDWRDLKRAFKQGGLTKEVKVIVGEKDWVKIMPKLIRCDVRQLYSKLKEIAGSVIL